MSIYLSTQTCSPESPRLGAASRESRRAAPCALSLLLRHRGLQRAGARRAWNELSRGAHRKVRRQRRLDERSAQLLAEGVQGARPLRRLSDGWADTVVREQFRLGGGAVFIRLLHQVVGST